ncbi:MAG TPA: cytochrome c3 family protein [Candidatus Acidoferrales bacterium]|nr:cytochrome c3 family protein [Candidatus Acidoferrales bacterium]
MRFGCGLGLLLACALAAPLSARPQTPAASKKTFVGSSRCTPCHADIYQSWLKTRMANIVRDPKQHPEAVLGDFAHPTPAVTFDLSQVAFVYGSRWKQRYFTMRGDEYYVLPAQWDIKHQRWLPFHVEPNADWWVKYYPDSNFERPTGPLCDGCHSVNYDLATKKVSEWNVGCEKCHGPGSEHVEHPSADNIVNPAKLDFVRGNDVCIQCHSQGRPLKNPIEGHYVDWPVGFLPGERLADFWRLEDRKFGQQDFYYFQDGTAHKNRMQGNDFSQAVMYHRGVRCFDCHDVHSDRYESDLIAPVADNTLCLRCHGPDTQPGPHMSVTQHTHHAEGSAGSRCIACHMPLIETTLGDNFVAAHTFRFISPQLTKQFGTPNPCTSCHTDKSPDWALEQLATWQTVSPWRVLQ